MIAAKLSQQTGLKHPFFIDDFGTSAIRRDEEGIGLAVELAHVAGLAVFLARDGGMMSRHALKDVAGTHGHAGIALGATIRDE